MKSKRIISSILATITLFSLSGCSLTRENINVNERLLQKSNINSSQFVTDETATNYITDESGLVDNTYYILHNGKYYPLAQPEIRPGESEDKMNNLINTGNQYVYTPAEEDQIPTLFPGDSLIYYSTSLKNDIYTFTRYYDESYSIPIFGLIGTAGDNAYFIINKDDDTKNTYVLNDIPELKDFNGTEIIIKSVGGADVKFSNLVDNGVIKNLQKNNKYDIELYDGTIYKSLILEAAYHYFREYERFVSLDFKTLKSYTWSIDIPSYFVDGYYTVNGGGMFRYSTNLFYADSTDWNERLLYHKVENHYFLFPNSLYDEEKDYEDYYPLNEDNECDKNEWIWCSENCQGFTDQPAVYSTNDTFNFFVTNVAGTLGYQRTNNLYETLLNSLNSYSTPKITVEEHLQVHIPKDNNSKKHRIIVYTEEKNVDIYFEYENGSICTPVYNETEKCYIFDLVKSDYDKAVSGRIVFINFNEKTNISLINVYVGELKEETEEPGENTN